MNSSVKDLNQLKELILIEFSIVNVETNRGKFSVEKMEQKSNSHGVARWPPRVPQTRRNAKSQNC